MNDTTNRTWTIQLGQYALAAGAVGAVSSSAIAVEQPFSPPGGLPITVDDTNVTIVDLDIDGDLTADFRLYRETGYGGGFAIGALLTGDSNHQIRAYFPQYSPSVNYGIVQRFDTDEPVSETGYNTVNGRFHPGADGPDGSNNPVAIDLGGDASTPAYLPFRGNPGFISLVLRSDSGTGGVTPLQPRVAYLEVVVSADGTELQILSGAYQDTNFDDYLLLPATSPVAKGLAELAVGDR